MTGETSPGSPPGDAAERPLFRRRHRIGHALDFKAAFEHRLRKSRGPLTVFVRPTTHAEHRLGLSVGRRFGPAVQRSAFKRRMREVFRLSRASLPRPTSGSLRSFDVVVTARAHEPMDHEAYMRAFVDAVAEAAREHARRSRRSGSGAEGGSSDV